MQLEQYAENLQTKMQQQYKKCTVEGNKGYIYEKNLSYNGCNYYVIGGMPAGIFC